VAAEATPDPRDGLAVLAQQDPVIAAAIERVGIPPDRRRPCAFDTLVRVVVGQQLSVKAAATIYGRLEDLLGGPPNPAGLRAQTDTALRSVGLSKSKLASLRDLSDAAVRGELNVGGLASLDNEAVAAHLLPRRGVGPWTVDMMLLFSLGRPDVWPTGDLGVRAGLQRLLRLPYRPTPKQTEAFGARWAPHRSSVAMLCWRLLHVEGPHEG